MNSHILDRIVVKVTTLTDLTASLWGCVLYTSEKLHKSMKNKKLTIYQQTKRKHKENIIHKVTSEYKTKDINLSNLDFEELILTITHLSAFRTFDLDGWSTWSCLVLTYSAGRAARFAFLMPERLPSNLLGFLSMYCCRCQYRQWRPL